MTYRYLVSFFWKKHNEHGFGETWMDHATITEAALEKERDDLKMFKGYTTVVFLSVIKLERV